MPTASLERCSFTYYPDIATGYSGFTDYHAMRSDLNNNEVMRETVGTSSTG
jgi:hypothetical protein